MANKKITDLTELTEAASDDYLEIVDTSANTSKKISRENLIAGHDHGSLAGLSNNDHPQYLLAATGKAADSDKLDGYDSTDFGRPVFLTAALTSTAWDGDAFSTTEKTKIDLSEVFGVPAGIKAVLAKIAIRDSGSAATSCRFQLSGVSSGTNYSLTVQASPINDRYAYFSGIVPCDANGDIYYMAVASDSGTMDIYLEIWGYWL